LGVISEGLSESDGSLWRRLGFIYQTDIDQQSEGAPALAVRLGVPVALVAALLALRPAFYFLRKRRAIHRVRRRATLQHDRSGEQSSNNGGAMKRGVVIGLGCGIIAGTLIAFFVVHLTSGNAKPGQSSKSGVATRPSDEPL